ncbi:MAG TPA: hypothetical protein GX393_03415 [Firmicutes bacterium]|nr:hypothetical protein [Bacillota bacterium]
MELNETQVDLLIAILVRFPCVGTIHCEPETGTLRLVFLLKAPDTDFALFAKRFQAHLTLFHKLAGRPVKTSELRRIETEQLTVVEVVRDLASFSLSELKLIVQLMRDSFRDSLVQEGSDAADEDAAEQEMIIDALLRERAELGQERLTGFRENGRVLVFSSAVGVDRQ